MSETFVLDNSVVMSWCFEDEANEYADSVMRMLVGTRAIVPGLWPLEVINVLLVAERKKRITASAAERFIVLLHELPITIESPSTSTMRDLIRLARDTGLSSYDAAYLNLAMTSGSALATLDKKLIAAARAVGVPLV